MKRFTLILLGATAISGTLAGCSVGPNYHRPDAPVEQHFTASEGWTPATPADQVDKSAWWRVYNDPVLDGLEQKVVINNQNVAQAEAVVRQMQATVAEDRAALWPTLGLTFGASRSGGSGAAAGTAGGTATTGTTNGNRFSAGLDAAWSIDIWGKVRRTIEENEANAQASEATLANATLSTQVTLATTIINLRVTDANIDLLTRTVKEYEENLRVVANAVHAGFNLYPPSNEITAKVQLENAKASLIALGVTRAQYAHAIAVLVGKNPEDLDIPHSEGLPALPNVPVGVPSMLLQRRPDIAAAERTMKAQNAAVGVAIAAYYPDISLSADFGLLALSHASETIWSLGASGTETILDFGARDAQVAAAKAAYYSAVATYRATVLTAFQSVENDLVGLRILAQQADVLEDAVRDSRRGTEIAHNEYQAGTVDYTTVATAMATQLTDEQNALSVRQTRLIDAATLIGDLGGGWTDAQLHDAQHTDDAP